MPLCTLLLLLTLSVCTMGQKQNVKLKRGNPQQSALMYTWQQLRTAGVDSIMTFTYDYDNGVSANAISYLVWMKNGQGIVKVFNNKEILTTSQASIRADSLFAFYIQNKLGSLPALEPCHVSHDMGYDVSVYLLGKTEHYRVRNCQRNQIKQVNIPLPGEDIMQPTVDPRSVLVDMFEHMVK